MRATGLAAVVALAAGCLPDGLLFPKTTPPPAAHPVEPTPGGASPVTEPEPVGALDMGGAYAQDLNGTKLTSHLGYELGLAAGWRLGRNAVVLRGVVDIGGENPDKDAVVGGSLGPSLLRWETIPMIDLPIELEAGLGFGVFHRPDEAAHEGLAFVAGVGVPLVHDHSLLLSARILNVHSADDAVTSLLPPFGDQQLLSFSLALSWRSS